MGICAAIQSALEGAASVAASPTQHTILRTFMRRGFRPALPLVPAGLPVPHQIWHLAGAPTLIIRPRMRILIVSNLFPPDYIGGQEINAWKIAHALRGRGHEVEVATSQFR